MASAVSSASPVCLSHHSYKKCADKTEENEESCLVRSYNSDKTIQFSKILNVGFLYYTVGPISHTHDEVKHCCGAVDRDLTICCW